MKDIGKRIEFHSHTLLSDGALHPAALAREAEVKGHAAIAMTDHVDAANMEFVLQSMIKFIKVQGKSLNIKVLPGVEISYVKPEQIKQFAKEARKLGAKIVIVHGESPVENVYPGTNLETLKLKGLVDILAHPGNTLSIEEAKLAAENDIFLELTARRGHKEGNKHVAEMAKKTGAKLIVDTDAHSEADLITQEQALNIAMEAELSEAEALVVVRDNALELLNKRS